MIYAKALTPVSRLPALILQMILPLILGIFMALSLAGGALGQASPLGEGWKLDAGASNIRFQSVKKTTVVESSSFATFNGAIAPDGTASISVLLDSVDTKVDLRNVRMRFLFFETFKFPQATISAHITPEILASLAGKPRATISLPFRFSLHGVEKEMVTDVVVTQLGESAVSIASAAPISIAVADFALEENLHKLEEAVGGITILPSAAVTFDFVFNKAGAGEAVQTEPTAEPEVSAALEEQGNFSAEACVGRFEILSRTGNIFFRTGSARLDDESAPLLAEVVDIVTRCPGQRLEISGHTDSDGDEGSNQRLSEARAKSVADYLASQGIARDRLTVVGYGETQPFVTNDSAANKARNRRIEFAPIN